MIRLYNWNDLPREFVRKGIERCGFRGENVMLIMNWAEPEIQINPHKHDFEQIAVCIQGRMKYHVGEGTVLMTPGSMLRIPANTMHYAEPVGDETVLNLDIFARLRPNYRHLVEYQADEFKPKDPGV